MSLNRRKTGFFLSLLLLLSLLLTFAFLAWEADHHCIGENCPVCVQGAVLKNILKGAPLAAFALTGTGMALPHSTRSLTSLSLRAGGSLVEMKVKLSD